MACWPSMVAAALRRAFLQADHDTARQTWRQVADQLRPRWSKLATPMDDREHDVLAFMAFPVQHRTKLHGTNPLERVNKPGYPGRPARGGPFATSA